MTLTALAVLAAAGCTNVPLEGRTPVTSGSAETLFLKSLEELPESGSSPSLEALRRNFPESDWTARADDLAELYDSCRQSKRRARELNQNLIACEAENRRSQKQIEQLKNDLQHMKDLVIEMELRSK